MSKFRTKNDSHSTVKTVQSVGCQQSLSPIFAAMKELLYFVFAVVLISCTQTEPAESETAPPKEKVELNPIQKIEEAHSKQDFLSKDVVQFDIILKFGGTERLNGSMTLATNSSRGHISYENGKDLYFDQNKVFVSPETENTASARFSAYTWQYFFLFPYKLSDPGTNWSKVTEANLNGNVYNSQKLTFGDGVGDAPDDWYITYSDSESNLMEVAAYIVTAGSTVEEAEEDPHAISYHDYKDVDGIVLAHSWQFREWRKDSGLTRQLGSAELSNFKFIEADKSDLLAPEGSIEIEQFNYPIP
ncbi:MAG: hypothetical protein ACJAQ4_000682 [Cryomorphaceae bacterium]